MKKITALLAVLLCMAMVLSACGGTTSTPTSEPAADGSAATSTAAGDSSAAEGGEEADAFEFYPEELQVNVIDDTTLEVNLVARTPYFLELTAFPTYMPVPMHMVENDPEGWTLEGSTYIGNGPYQMTEWVPSSHITMEKNENYWNADAVGPQTIKFALIEDDTAQLNAFQAGELQFIDSMPQNEIDNLKNDPTFHTYAQLGTYYVSFNNQVEPFNDPLVRRAFSLAIDRDQIANVVGSGNYIPAGAWVPPGLGGDFRDQGGDYYDPSKEAYEANLQQAKDLLAEAGYPDGEGLPTIEYIYNDTTLHKNVAEALQNMWGELGATVSIDVQEWSTFLNSRKNGEFMAARDGWLTDYNDPIGVLDLFITGGGNNNSQYKNAEYDALISKIKSTGDDAERTALMHEAEDILMNEWVFAPIMYYGDPYMIDEGVNESGFYFLPLGWKLFDKVQGFETLDICTGPQPDTIDPALNSSVDGGIMILHAFDGLYRLDENGVPQPALAESCDISEDGLTYTFKLKEGLTWSDGTPLTAQTIKDSWIRAINPETAADYSNMFECIAGYAEALPAAEAH